MAADPPEGYADDFLNQILAIDSYTNLSIPDSNSSDTTSLSSAATAATSPLNSGAGHHHHHQPLFPLGLSLDNGRSTTAVNGGAFAAQRERGLMNIGGLFQPFEHLQPHSLHHTVPQALQGSPTTNTAVTVQNPPSIRPRVRARRGQATDPHSIAERLRRERIAERMRALQELVPSCNKTDKGAMLDEILDYVKFLRLQVKVLSMSRLGGAGAVAQLVSDIPLQSVEGDLNESGLNNQPTWETWSNNDTESEVAKLMEEDMGAAMQFLQSKALCIMPISLASLIYPTQQQDASNLVKPESGPTS